MSMSLNINVLPPEIVFLCKPHNFFFHLGRNFSYKSFMTIVGRTGSPPFLDIVPSISMQEKYKNQMLLGTRLFSPQSNTFSQLKQQLSFVLTPT